eukprot:366102-Chlamydomonas_euryale.AAC.16
MSMSPSFCTMHCRASAAAPRGAASQYAMTFFGEHNTRVDPTLCRAPTQPVSHLYSQMLRSILCCRCTCRVLGTMMFGEHIFTDGPPRSRASGGMLCCRR